MRKLTEADHQTLVVCWAKRVCLAGRAELDLLMHIPNGEKRDAATASKLKRLGVRAGVSDLFLPVMKVFEYEIGGGVVKREVDGGLWIELKADGGKVSEEQWRWIYAMRKNGYRAEVCFGWQEAVAVIKDYLGGEWPEVDMSEMVSRLGGRVDG